MDNSQTLFWAPTALAVLGFVALAWGVKILARLEVRVPRRPDHFDLLCFGRGCGHRYQVRIGSSDPLRCPACSARRQAAAIGRTDAL